MLTIKTNSSVGDFVACLSEVGEVFPPIKSPVCGNLSHLVWGQEGLSHSECFNIYCHVPTVAWGEVIFSTMNRSGKLELMKTHHYVCVCISLSVNSRVKLLRSVWIVLKYNSANLHTTYWYYLFLNAKSIFVSSWQIDLNTSDVTGGPANGIPWC